MNVEIWSDVVCPWCYIGKRHFEAALGDFDHAAEVTLTWRSFQLDPSAPAISAVDPLERLATKYGMSREQASAAHQRVTDVAAAAGLEYHLDKSRSGNTFDAHRLLHYAAAEGKQDALKERLMAAYFCEGEAIGDHAVLARLAGDVGLDTAEAKAILEDRKFEAEVTGDIQDARELGITGVPFFVIDRKYGISGAQPADLLLRALRQAWNESHVAVELTAVASETDAVCADDSCAV